MYCKNCGTPMEDNATFCGNCGTPVAQAPVYAPVYADPADHTAEFDPRDISENKVLAMTAYILGIPGIIIALLADSGSPYAAFHSRQALKLEIVNVLLAIIALILCWTVIVPMVAGVCVAILLIVRIICFFNVCSGKAKEAPIIRTLNFLK